MRVIIAGGRYFNDYPLLKRKMNIILRDTKEPIIIISGTAAGADKLGEQYAAEKGYRIEKYPADWTNMNVTPCVQRKRKDGTLYNAAAGNIRNSKMADNGDSLVAFWDGKSTGTKDMISLAKNKGLKIRIIYYTL